MHAILNILVLLQSLVTRWVDSTHTRRTRSRAVGSKGTKPPATLCKKLSEAGSWRLCRRPSLEVVFLVSIRKDSGATGGMRSVPDYN